MLPSCSRGIELLNEDGFLGAITSRTGFFLTTFEGWRSELVLPRTLALIDLGVGVMHDAMVEAAAYVLSSQPHHRQASFRRILDYSDKAEAVYERTDQPFVRRPEDFALYSRLASCVLASARTYCVSSRRCRRLMALTESMFAGAHMRVMIFGSPVLVGGTNQRRPWQESALGQFCEGR